MQIISQLKSFYRHTLTPKAVKASALDLSSVEAASAYRTSYREKTQHLLLTKPVKAAMSLAIGGEFDAIGQLERALLEHLGLGADSFLVDVGCGSGRLAVQLKGVPCSYTGIDVVEDLLNYARATCKRPDWKFAEAVGFSIPEADGVADFVCFFSVITHLSHADAFRYLRDAARVLRPGGKIVISFLEFKIPAHWAVFAQLLDEGSEHQVLNQFISRDALGAWATHLNLEVDCIHDGDTPHIPIANDITMENGTVMTGMGYLGQSVCVLSKPCDNPANLFKATVSGPVLSRTVNLEIAVRDAMHGKQAHIYVAAKEPDKDTLYGATPKGFTAQTLSLLQPIQTVTLGEHAVSIQLQLPGVSADAALELYVGFGSSPDAMIKNGDYGLALHLSGASTPHSLQPQ